MSRALPASPAGGVSHSGDGAAVARVAAGWLNLAAAPTFAMMALLTAVFGGGQMATICSTGSDASPLSGMVPMYLLMSAFHLAAWLRLVGRSA